jgi:hypothetical protein
LRKRGRSRGVEGVKRNNEGEEERGRRTGEKQEYMGLNGRYERKFRDGQVIVCFLDDPSLGIYALLAEPPSAGAAWMLGLMESEERFDGQGR